MSASSKTRPAFMLSNSQNGPASSKNGDLKFRGSLTTTDRAYDDPNSPATDPITNGKHHDQAEGLKNSTRHQQSRDFVFGGPWGTGAMVIGFPLLVYYLWIGAAFYDGHLPRPAADQSLISFLNHLVDMVLNQAYPGLRAWKIYWSFLILEAVFYCYLPGVQGYGKPLRHEGGKQLKYHCSAVWSFYVTILLGVIFHVTGIFRLYTVIDEFGPILSVSVISSFLVAIVAYVSAWARGARHRITGYFVYDFFMGTELNPRLGPLDFKMFLMVRIPWFILLAISCATAAKQYELYSYVSAEVWFLVGAHFLYANACAKGEECILATWDIYYENWGFMLMFWNLCGVPFSYCHCALYFANNLETASQWSNPALRTPTLIALFISYIFVYWVWDTTNSQKNRFRAQEAGQLVIRKTFPQLPWQTIRNPRKLTTASGDTILIDGWYGYARKLHYTCDVYFALMWGAITGFESPLPWFYPVFFTCMIVHRAYRDIERCREKYGETWAEYEKAVPYMFIPYLI